uniref:Uncharacterized protein n=1 Tax=Avena sativa TaxID=4498 RepID=A0ACD5XC50_AVESA
MDRGSGVGAGGGMPPPPHQQITDDVGLAARRDAQFLSMRNCFRERIFDYNIGRTQMPSDWPRRQPELARRLEEILFRKFPNKSEYYTMMRGPIEPHLEYAIKFLHDQDTQRQRNLEMSREIASSPGHGTTTPTPGIMQSTSENPRMSYVTHPTGPFSPIADCVPWNANTGEAHDEHVNTRLSLGMNYTTHHRSRLSNYSPTPPAPVKEVPKEPKFSCPVCMNELVDASSTICGHIFCEYCIGASILAQSKCLPAVGR